MMTSAQAKQQARAERLTLRVADNRTGYFGVCLKKAGQPKPYQAKLVRGGKDVYLGRFATAEEAALSIARSPEGQAAAKGAATATPPLTSEEARQQAQAEGLTLRVAGNKTGYLGVNLANIGYPKPYQAKLRRGGNDVNLGTFATAEEAALCIARSPEGQAAARRAAAALVPLTSKEARQQAQAEGLTLRVADSRTGYAGVQHQPGKPRPYQARVSRGGKQVYLGCFASAEEAALCVARSPERQEAATAAPPLTSKEARQQAQAEQLTLLVADSTTGYFGVHHQPVYRAQLKRTFRGSFTTAEEAALCVARSPEEGLAHGLAASRSAAAPQLTSEDALQQARDAIVREAALDIIHEAAGAATAELSAEVAVEVMAGIAMGL